MAGGAGVVGCNYFDEMTKMGKVHKRFMYIAAMAYFFDLLDMNLFGKVAPSVQAYFSLTLQQMGTINSLSFWGMAVGGLFGGWMADKVGRKNTLLFNIALFSIGSICNAYFHNFYLFCFFRFITGFGIIGMNIVAMVYISEMMPSASRGKYQGLTVAIGSASLPLFAFFAAWIIPMSPESWRIIFIIGGAGIFLVPLGMSWLRESPRWLVMKGRVKEAEAVVAECLGHPADLSGYATACVEKSVSLGETFGFLCSKKQLRNTLVLGIMAVGGICGGFFMGSWNLNFLVTMGYDLQFTLFVVAFTMFATPVGDITASIISDKGGRRTPVVIMLFAASFFYLLTGLIPNFFPDVTHGAIAFGIIGFCKAAAATCMMTIFWTYLAESIPNRYRGSASGLIMSFSRVLVAAITPLVPIIFAAYGWFGVNLTNSLFYLIPAIVALLFGAKTAGKSLEEIESEVHA